MLALSTCADTQTDDVDIVDPPEGSNVDKMQKIRNQQEVRDYSQPSDSKGD